MNGGDKKETPAERTPLSENSEHICERADAVLEHLISRVGADVTKAPEDRDARDLERLLVYLAVLNRREGEATKSQHRAELTELARLMETSYIEFWVRDTAPDRVVIDVFDRALFRHSAELTFRKLPFQPHYVFERYKSL